jgi:DNA-binding GntR family transcriptional regulator
MSPADEVIDPLPKGHLLVEIAYLRLREAILSNRLPPGTPLSVPEFARRFQVSRSPVREAVQRLVFEGLAINVVHKGAEVAGVQLADLQQLYIVREVLEGLSARLATERIDPEGLAALRRILEEHEHVVASGEEQGHIELDMEFHRTIREACDNDYVVTTLTRLEGKSHLALFHLWRGPDGPRFAVDEHKRVYAAMAAGDPTGAEEAARAHIAQLRVRLNQYSGAKPRRPGSRGGGDEDVA